MKNRKVIMVLLLMVIVLTAAGFCFWYQSVHYIITEDARVDGNVVKVSPSMTGEILELNFEENQMVEKGQYLGRLSDRTLAPGGNLDLTLLKSPIKGYIIKKISSTGEIAAPASPIALVTDLDSLYITANIEEDVLHLVKAGQQVDITIDSFPGVRYQGHIQSIGSAANSVFSILPAQNSSGSFTKVTQRIPVTIVFNKPYQQRLLPGMNARVVVHL